MREEAERLRRENEALLSLRGRTTKEMGEEEDGLGEGEG